MNSFIRFVNFNTINKKSLTKVSKFVLNRNLKAKFHTVPSSKSFDLRLTLTLKLFSSTTVSIFLFKHASKFKKVSI